MRRIFVLVAAAAVLATPAGSSTRSRLVYLAPVGPVSHLSLANMRSHLERRLGVEVRPLPEMSLPSAAYDGRRKQYVGDKLTDALVAHFARSTPGGVVIGVTEADMYPLSLPWRFEFSDRIDRGAVVSVARMDPHFYGLDRDPARLLRRGEKMVTKNVGILVFGRQPSPDPRSVLYTPGGLPDLDYMTLDFDPKPFSSAKRTWLGSVGAACARAGRLERKLGYKKPSHAQITQLLKRLVVIEESLYADLRTAPPAAEDRVGVTRMLRTYAAWLRVNIHAADALSRRWDDAVFARWRGQTVQFGSEVAGDMLELGSRQCAAHVS